MRSIIFYYYICIHKKQKNMLTIYQNGKIKLHDDFFNDLEYYSIKHTESGFVITKYYGVSVPKYAKKRHKTGNIYNWIGLPIGIYNDYEIDDNKIFYETIR